MAIPRRIKLMTAAPKKAASNEDLGVGKDTAISTAKPRAVRTSAVPSVRKRSTLSLAPKSFV